MARRSHGRGSLPAPKRQIANDGVDAANSAQLAIGAASSGVIALGSNLLLSPAATLVRTRGSVLFKISASGSANNKLNGAFGIIVASDQAVSIGITALPSPITEIENDWVVWVPFTGSADLAATTQTDLGAFSLVQFDSKGMRKMKEGESLVGVFEVFQSDATTGTFVDIVAQYRMQFKL